MFGYRPFENAPRACPLLTTRAYVGLRFDSLLEPTCNDCREPRQGAKIGNEDVEPRRGSKARKKSREPRRGTKKGNQDMVQRTKKGGPRLKINTKSGQ